MTGETFLDEIYRARAARAYVCVCVCVCVWCVGAVGGGGGGIVSIIVVLTHLCRYHVGYIRVHFDGSRSTRNMKG